MTGEVSVSGDGSAPLHESLYQTLREKLAKGILAPGKALSLRNLAAELGGSVTPVRDAVWRLTAEHALAISSTRRISVPDVDHDTIRELLKIRGLLEPEAAALALPNLTPDIIAQMSDADARMNEAVRQGDVEGYMANNHAFHFTLYRASRSDVLVPIVEALWVRFGPFMRHSYPDVAGMQGVDDHHAEALDAIKANDETALRRAISADVNDALNYILHDLGQKV